MLATWGRVLTTGLNATTKSLPVYKTVIPIAQFFPTTTRALATATAPKKAATTTTKKTTTTTTTKAKTPTKTTATTSTTKKAPAKTVATKKALATTNSRNPKAVVNTKAAPKKPAKKPLTDEEKLKIHVKDLLERALDPPSIHTPSSTWVSFLKEKFAASKSSGVSGPQLLEKYGAQWKNEYKALTPAQLENLKAKADADKEASRAELTKWIYSHTPAQIYQANLARIQIRKLKNNHDPAPRGLRGKSFPAIPDDRYPRRPKTAQIFYVMDKLVGVPTEKKMAVVPEAMKGFANLPAAEQNKYKELAAQDIVRFHNELRTVGIQPSA